MDDFEKLLHEQLADDEFKNEWEQSEAEYQIAKLVFDARLKSKLTQKQLAELSGIRQSNISRIENGDAIPTLKTLFIIAKSLGKELHIEIR